MHAIKHPTLPTPLAISLIYIRTLYMKLQYSHHEQPPVIISYTSIRLYSELQIAVVQSVRLHRMNIHSDLHPYTHPQYTWTHTYTLGRRWQAMGMYQ